jgi:hypothetical protein
MTSFDPKVLARINDVLTNPDERFDHLIKVAGLDPKRDLRFSDLRNTDFKGSILRRWDFTGADLRGASFHGARIFDCVFAGAKGVNLSGAINESDKILEAPKIKSQAPVQLPEKRDDYWADDRLDTNQRFALAAIIQYHFATSRIAGAYLTRQELGMKAGLDALNDQLLKSSKPKDGMRTRTAGMLVSSFLDNASETGAFELREFYKRLVFDKSGPFRDAPPHIVAAIDTVYPEPQVEDFSLASVFSNVRHKDHGDILRFGRAYAGIWNMFRYAAQVDRAGAAKAGRSVVRAAMQIGLADGRNRGPWFKIHTRSSDGHMSVVTGSIILVDRGMHFYMAGLSHDSNSLLSIMGQCRPPAVDFFRGIVIQRHSRGSVFASRVSFARSKATSIEDLADKIGIFRESELRTSVSSEIDNIDLCLREAVNGIPSMGKDALFI